MKVTFDVLRENATYGMNELHDVLKEIIESGNLNDYHIDKLKLNWNQAARFVGIFNYLHDDTVENDMTDLSDLDINTFEEQE